jgi:hypothetical protein
MHVPIVGKMGLGDANRQNREKCLKKCNVIVTAYRYRCCCCVARLPPKLELFQMLLSTNGVVFEANSECHTAANH